MIMIVGAYPYWYRNDDLFELHIDLHFILIDRLIIRIRTLAPTPIKVKASNSFQPTMYSGCLSIIQSAFQLPRTYVGVAVRERKEESSPSMSME